MDSPTVMTPTTIIMFVVFVMMQIATISSLPRTEGFSNLNWTVLVIVLSVVSMWLLARIIQAGTPLGVATPVASALVPLASIAIGVGIYAESHSLTKLALLSCACIMVGVAGALK